MQYTKKSQEQIIKELREENRRLAKDLEKYKEAEEALKISEARYRAVVEDQTELICRCLPDFTLTFINEAYCRFFSLKAEDILGKSFLSLIPEEDQETCIKTFSSLRPEQSVITYEHRVITASGKIAWQEWTDRAIFDGNGNLMEIQSVGRDITRRKEIIEALEASNKKFSKAFSASPNLMVITSLEEGRYIEVNEQFCNITGYSREEIINKTVKEKSIWSHMRSRENFIKKLLENGSVRNLEINMGTKSGHEHLGLLSSDLIWIDDEQCIISMIADITEVKQLQEKMARLAQLNLIGEIAASIGHEIRNPMTSVRGFLQMFSNYEQHFPQQDYFALMIEELDRANSIISEFLSLAKNKAVYLQNQNLNTILQNLSPLLIADALDQDKSLSFQLGDIPEILLDEKEIRQLIFNLVRNGIEATASGGTVMIETYKEKRNVIMTIVDEGSGIKPEILEKIGEPFFTTKNHGTGLGLSVCYSIAARHNASIEIDSHSGGSTFLVRFRLEQE